MTSRYTLKIWGRTVAVPPSCLFLSVILIVACADVRYDCQWYFCYSCCVESLQSLLCLAGARLTATRHLVKREESLRLSFKCTTNSAHLIRLDFTILMMFPVKVSRSTSWRGGGIAEGPPEFSFASYLLPFSCAIYPVLHSTRDFSLLTCL
jgi:hypothetical protein